MIERVVENWLTSTNERGYEVPFCQLLLSQGHSVVHLSTHGMMEQGKDIITIGPDGVPCAFQLKAGNVGVGEWRSIFGEIEELVSLPIRHPSIPKAKQHRAYLVTNGLINDAVQGRIRALNEKSKHRRDPRLDTIVKDQLLAGFTQIHGQFFPTELKTIREFLQLYLSRGESPIRKAEVSNFLCTMLMTDEHPTRLQLQRAIASVVIVNGYLVGSHNEKKNHYALFEGWMLLASHIMATAERYRLSEKHWSNSFDLAMTAALRSLNDLKEEVLTRNQFVEGDGFNDGPVYRCRMTVVLGCLAALELFGRITHPSQQSDDRVRQFIQKHEKELQYWGESATPFFLALGWYLENFRSSHQGESYLVSMALNIARANHPSQKHGLTSPYYDVENSLRIASGIGDLQSKFDKETFVGASFSLESLVHMIARRNLKHHLRSMWDCISYVDYSQFIPKPSWSTYLWHSEDGELRTRKPGCPQSWSALRTCASRSDLKGVPKHLAKQPAVLLLFLLVYPHRLRPALVKCIDDVIGSTA